MAFISQLRHSKGEWAGQRFTLEPWQENDIVRPLFGTLGEDGLRQYRTAYISEARKNGKSALCAAIALYLLFADGEMGAEVYSCAADKDQASIVFSVAAQMVRQSPALARRCRIIDSTKRIVVYSTASFYRAVSSDVPTKHGLNPSGVIFDELHAQPNRQLWDVMTTGSGTRRQPLVVAITTAGTDPLSICGEQYEYAQKVLKGVIRDPRFFAYIREVPRDADWTDEKLWPLANPALGTFRKIDEMREFAVKAKNVPALQNTFRRFYLNQWVQQETRWLDLAKWDETEGEVDQDELKGLECYAGLDLASTTDIAAFVLVFPIGGGFAVLPHFFIPEVAMMERATKDRVPYDAWVRQGLITATPGNVIDYKAIMAHIEAAAETYNIREIAFDRWGAAQLSQDLDGAGFTMVPFGQGFASMSAPTKELMNLVLQRRIWHGGNPVLRWMADNLVVRTDPAGNLKPDKSKSREKIDGMVATIMALDRAIRHQAGGSIYEDRDLRFI